MGLEDITHNKLCISTPLSIAFHADYNLSSTLTQSYYWERSRNRTCKVLVFINLFHYEYVESSVLFFVFFFFPQASQEFCLDCFSWSGGTMIITSELKARVNLVSSANFLTWKKSWWWDAECSNSAEEWFNTQATSTECLEWGRTVLSQPSRKEMRAETNFFWWKTLAVSEKQKITLNE